MKTQGDDGHSQIKERDLEQIFSSHRLRATSPDGTLISDFESQEMRKKISVV